MAKSRRVKSWQAIDRHTGKTRTIRMAERNLSEMHRWLGGMEVRRMSEDGERRNRDTNENREAA